MVIIGLFFSFVSLSLYAFNFNVELQVPYFFRDEIEQLNGLMVKGCIEKSKHDFLWHLFFFNQLYQNQSSIMDVTGRSVLVAVLDTDDSCGKHWGDCRWTGCDNLNFLSGVGVKVALGCEIMGSQPVDQKKKKLASELMRSRQFLRQLLQKNHAHISHTLIRQIAPSVEIVSIPVLDEYGNADKQKLYDGLIQAYQNNVDIVHLGLQIYDFDLQQELDQKIIALLGKFEYVVASAGNFAPIIDHVGYPALLSDVISVGSCSKKGQRYQHSSFCQATMRSPVDFIMPGKNIWVSLWVDEIKDFVIMPVSGTSMSAAFMTGALALILEKNNGQLDRRHVIELLCFCSKKCDISWNDCVTYGTPLIPKILSHLDDLSGLTKKKMKQYFLNLRS